MLDISICDWDIIFPGTVCLVLRLKCTSQSLRNAAIMQQRGDSKCSSIAGHMQARLRQSGEPGVRAWELPTRAS